MEVVACKRRLDTLLSGALTDLMDLSKGFDSVPAPVCDLVFVTDCRLLHHLLCTHTYCYFW